MPNQAPQTADSKPKARKAAATPKETTAPKSRKPKTAPASGPSDAPPKTTRKRTPKATADAAAVSPVAASAHPVSQGTVATGHAATASGVVLNKAAILTEVTYEMIAVRAYFLAENRQTHGGHGDPSGDWHEAERQLHAEAAAIDSSLNRKH